MRAKYRALRAFGFDPLSAGWVAFVSYAVQPDDVISLLNIDIKVPLQN